MANRTPSSVELPHTGSQRGRSLLDTNYSDVSTKLSTVPTPEGPPESVMDSNPDLGTSLHTHEPTGPSEDTVRPLCDASVTPITYSITEYEGNLKANDARLQALEQKAYILPDAVMVLESHLDRLTCMEDHLATKSEQMKEKD